MIKKQIRIVHEKIKSQVHAVLGTDRRKNRAYRDYMEHLYDTQEFTKDREVFMMTVTLSHRALYEMWRECGSQEVWCLLSDGKPIVKKDISI